MTTTINLQTWEEFETAVARDLRFQWDWDIEMGVYPRIWRGQADAEWPLATTLERAVGRDLRLRDYLYLMSSVVPEVETFTGKEWAFPSLDVLNAWLNDHSAANVEKILEGFMVYLRHHQFPSPLLDWSVSPYIAAYFACREVQNRSDGLAIYAASTQPVLEPRHPLGPADAGVTHIFQDAVRTTTRHFLQQSVYTYCTRRVGDESRYVSHEEVYGPEERDEILVKYVIPSSERGNALLALHAYNINSYALFGTQEALLETAFLKNFALASARKSRHPEKDWRLWP